VARLVVSGGELVVRLNPLEKVMDLRVRSPRFALADVSRCAAVEAVWDDVLRAPHGVRTRRVVDFGASEGLLGRLVTVLSRGRHGSARAIVVAYGNRPAVVVDVPRSATPWNLVVVTTRRATAVAAAIDAAR